MPVSPAYAQAVSEERGRFELAAGASWTGRESFSSRDASETAPAGGRSRLFSTSAELAPSPGVEARAGVTLTRVLQVEVSSSYGRPQLRTTISNDVENAATFTAGERVRQFTVDGAVVLRLPRWRVGRRSVPFLSAGAGYMRQLHEGETLSATGRTYHLGGGLKILLTSRPKGMKGLGLRVDARALIRTKGVAFDTSAHVSPVLAASLFVRF
jgi:hypothetical protein